ncbi:hypothetical protein IQ230_01965 [Gloeocapsopsis crepidinum LEGE 06123]|uniref:Uncharacterized protein n=1 Tax=Gloeocapsopsis crepidinum LEGE 06123 TaxID=588587 RepID=A0ABR9ULI7_9CHRO|nr:hypothetical protein [Gloeocapsopsis crepidinum]MBE9189150.1 hypothetical protein [Gloeocapsopsis crepidinum LEGE 06123]
MGILRRNYKKYYPETQLYSRSSNRFLSKFAIAFSTLAIIFSSLTLARVFTLQREVESLEDSIRRLTTLPSPVPSTNLPNTTDSNIPSPPPVVVPYSTTAPLPTRTLPPGQFVQSALNNQGQVELLQVNRSPHQANVVNVQIRIRALKLNIPMSEYIDLSNTTARNPTTNETYKAISGESTGVVSLGAMQSANQPVVDAYVWLQVPTQIEVIDIYIPNTKPFENVPIAS